MSQINEGSSSGEEWSQNEVATLRRIYRNKAHTGNVAVSLQSDLCNPILILWSSPWVVVDLHGWSSEKFKLLHRSWKYIKSTETDMIRLRRKFCNEKETLLYLSCLPVIFQMKPWDVFRSCFFCAAASNASFNLHKEPILGFARSLRKFFFLISRWKLANSRSSFAHPKTGLLPQ